MIPILAFDGDILNYRACGAAQYTEYDAVVDEEVIQTFRYAAEYKEFLQSQSQAVQDKVTRVPRTVLKPFSDAKNIVDQFIYGSMKRLGGKEINVFLSPEHNANFRTDLATILPYKGNRKDKEKPEHYHRMRKYLIERYGAIVDDDQEADDALVQFQYPRVMRLLHGNYPDMSDVSCIVGIDKDLKMCPGYHYDFTTGTLEWVSELKGMQTFYKQLLTGDMKSDNVPGLFQCTKKRCMTETMLNPIDSMTDEREMYEHVAGLYGEEHFDKMMEVAHLVWMRRERGVEWKPPV